MNIVEYFESRQKEIDARLHDIESGRIGKIVYDGPAGPTDVTAEEAQRLRQISHDYWRAAENLRRINSSQK